ncbi:unnamed protein product [Linum trigynum]|uniref:Uncharacterized protein n=1 Tax=Linum trigynum TaxID=586398 RepID=A0AAV2E7I5_9ROSI
MTNRGVIALYSLRSSVEPIHLGSLIATSFARCLGRNRVDTMHMGGLITRMAWHFQVDLDRCTSAGRTTPIPVETLYNQKLVLQGERGVKYLEGLRPSGVMRAELTRLQWSLTRSPTTSRTATCSCTRPPPVSSATTPITATTTSIK